MIYAKRISDPVHDTIGLTDVELRVLDCRAFQRLRNVKQLGLVHYVFPNADYSRFAHSIGVCHIAGRILDTLKGKSDSLSDEDIQRYRVAALVHDIGHYPFSHPMEIAIENHYSKTEFIQEKDLGRSSNSTSDDDKIERSYSHERVSREVLEHDPELKRILNDSGVDPKSLYAIFLRERERPEYTDIINSDLDADRIDYLLRTSHTTGLPYGSVDVDYLVSQLTFDKDHRICAKSKALRTVDHFLLSRYFDYQQVEYYKTVVGLELILKDVLQELLLQGMVDCSPKWIRKAIANGEWANFDDHSIWARVRQLDSQSGEDSVLKKKTQSLLYRRPPKLVGEIEYLGSREEQTVRDFRLKKGTLEQVREECSQRFGIDRELWYTWSHATLLTALPSSMSASAVFERSAEDEEQYEKLARIQDDDSSASRPIVEVRHSLMNILANYALYSGRLYVLLTPQESEERRCEIKQYIRGKWPDIGWK